MTDSYRVILIVEKVSELPLLVEEVATFTLYEGPDSDRAGKVYDRSHTVLENHIKDPVEREEIRGYRRRRT